ncbi:MAG TPA: hypothetical protein VFZ44_13005 [Pyrinomonadaceae bacterium]
MRLFRLKVAAAAVVLSAAGIVSGVARAVEDTTLKDISRYREWARITDAPLTVPVNLAAGGG